jgi:hypothetical protein
VNILYVYDERLQDKIFDDFEVQRMMKIAFAFISKDIPVTFLSLREAGDLLALSDYLPYDLVLIREYPGQNADDYANKIDRMRKERNLTRVRIEVVPYHATIGEEDLIAMILMNIAFGAYD